MWVSLARFWECFDARLTQVSEVQVLLIGEILISLDFWIVSLVSFGKLLVAELVWDHKCQSNQEDDHDLSYQQRYGEQTKRETGTDLGDSGDHADNDTSGVLWSFRLEKGVRADDVTETDSDKY